tara:strand:- start:284 stop:580 length:297 start_codon:yes stop_codon:yes gene_type:complete
MDNTTKAFFEPGLIFDAGVRTADELNNAIIELAESEGFTFEPTPPESDIDYSQVVSEVADEAIDFLNDKMEAHGIGLHFGLGENGEGFGVWDDGSEDE